MSTKRVRDPIHQFIELDSRAQAIVDAEAFQRLRGIGQLALTYLVYPGARHSRFEHSLGAMHVAAHLAERIVDEPNRPIVRLAALAHDVGHGPFSHVLDAVMTRHIGKEGIHERISRAVILEGPLRDGFESDDEAQAVVDLIDPPPHTRSVEQDIVNGPTDADKLDYLLRDSYFCGVRYGHYDFDRLLETAMVTGGLAQSQLGFEDGGLEAVEGLIFARQAMHRTVYRHDTRRATDLMLQRAILLAIGDGDALLSGLVPELDDADQPGIDGAFLDRYLGLDDERVRFHLEGLDSPAGELARDLRARRLVHEACQMNRQRIQAHRPGPFLTRLADRTQMTHDVLGHVESSIASDLRCQPHRVFVTVESPTNPLYRAPGWEGRKSDIFISGGRGEEYFHNLSDILRPDIGERAFFISLFTDGSERNVEPFAGHQAQDWELYLLEKIEEGLERT